eukprot:TRINITY_DN4092_c0_g1_i2.p1 TRINITY_DN4092_c0_g1~~TRINITY_DN4092_c0_g1_i2.p1  ORF type:complete len:117 (-),score=9.18 TRINITY_DN4092_c0_g1_i2:59-409(-)
MHPGVPFQSPYQASTTKPLLATIHLLGLAPLFSSSFSTNEQKASIKAHGSKDSWQHPSLPHENDFHPSGSGPGLDWTARWRNSVARGFGCCEWQPSLTVSFHSINILLSNVTVFQF